MLLSDGTPLLMETQKKNIINITWKKNIIISFYSTHIITLLRKKINKLHFFVFKMETRGTFNFTCCQGVSTGIFLSVMKCVPALFFTHKKKVCVNLYNKI